MKKEIITDIGTYKLALVTKEFIYYVNENEGDENGCVIMNDKKNNLVSDNYFAYNDYMEDMEKVISGSKVPFVDSYFLESAKQYFQENF